MIPNQHYILNNKRKFLLLFRNAHLTMLFLSQTKPDLTVPSNSPSLVLNNMSRTISTLVLVVLCASQSFCSTQPSIIIVGAGPSGVAAATRLLANNFNNLTILEAESRIGGRINSVYFGDAYVDLGAHWCHGEEDNIVYSLVKDLNLLRHTEKEAIIYHSRVNISSEFEAKLKGLIWSAYGSNTTGVNDSVRDFYLRK